MSRLNPWLDRRHLIFYFLVACAVIAYSTAFIPWISDLNRAVLAIPGAVSLSALIIQVLREEVAFEREKELKEREHNYGLATLSHMAQVVFDRQVEFCDAYAPVVKQIVMEEMRNGPCEQALQQAEALANIREKYALWIPKTQFEKLLAFENGLRELGSSAKMIDIVTDDASRRAFVDRAFNRLLNVVGIDPVIGQRDPQLAAAKVNDALRELLGASDFALLREYALGQAKAFVSKL